MDDYRLIDKILDKNYSVGEFIIHILKRISPGIGYATTYDDLYNMEKARRKAHKVYEDIRKSNNSEFPLFIVGKGGTIILCETEEQYLLEKEQGRI